MLYSRRKFLQDSSILLAASMMTTSFSKKAIKPLLSFSTLGCPDWEFERIIEFATQHHYDGIELRGILRELDLTKCKEFNTPKNIAATIEKLKKHKLHIAALGSSAMLHFAVGAERRKNIDEGKRFIDLANELACPAVRVFPNKIPKDQDRNETFDLISKGLIELADHAGGSKVKVLMETHGDVVYSDDIAKIMMSANHPGTGLVWDVCNMWTITREPPTEVYAKLKKYIYHTHIKDAVLTEGAVHYRLLGKGEVPVFKAIDDLANDGYRGYYCFEWEKMWHPEIDEPEIALAHYPVAMKEHFK
jgi:sugar phosphate isomerase/epimerase